MEAEEPTNPFSKIRCFSGLLSRATVSWMVKALAKEDTRCEAENTSLTGSLDGIKANLSFELIERNKCVKPEM
jgi:hypothetical protein